MVSINLLAPVLIRLRLRLLEYFVSMDYRYNIPNSCSSYSTVEQAKNIN